MSEETPQAPNLPDLTDRQAQFVALYLGECRMNAAEAARTMGYAQPAQEGWRMTHHPAVRAHIDAHLDAETMTAKEVLARLSRIGRGSMAAVADFNVTKEVTDRGRRRRVKKDWWPNFKRAVENGSIDLIKKLSYDKNGNPAVELYSATEALALIGKHHKLFTERVEHGGSVRLEDVLGSLDPDTASGVRGALGAALRSHGGAAGPGGE
jgi:hypothetical protein